MKQCVWMCVVFWAIVSSSSIFGLAEEGPEYSLGTFQSDEVPRTVFGPGCGTCDTAQLLEAIQACCAESAITAELLTSLTGCCNDVFSTLTTCCNHLITTLSVDIINTITDCCSTLRETVSTIDITATFTTTIHTTVTTCCNDTITTITLNFQDTFVTLNTILEALTTSTATAGACCPCTVITQATVDAAGGTYVITAPGNYTLAEDVTTTATVAVVIASSNVYFNACFHEISGATEEGVVVEGGLDNITITNGRIQLPLAARNGIHVTGPATNIILNNMYVTQAGITGIFLDGLRGQIQNSLVKDCYVNFVGSAGAGSVWGLHVYQCNDITIQGGNYSDNGSFGGGFVAGIELTLCTNCRVQNVFANSNSFASAVGIVVNNCVNCLLESCVAMHNAASSISGVAGGISVFNGKNNTIKGCIASDSTGDFIVGGAQHLCFGIELSKESYSTIIECVAQGNQTDDLDFNANSMGLGIHLDGAHFCTVTRTIVSSNNTAGIYDTALTLAAGAGSALTTGDSTTLLAENCALDNGTTLAPIIAGANSNNYIIAYGGATPTLPPTLFVSYSSATPFPAATTTESSLLGNIDVVS